MTRRKCRIAKIFALQLCKILQQTLQTTNFDRSNFKQRKNAIKSTLYYYQQSITHLLEARKRKKNEKKPSLHFQFKLIIVRSEANQK
jgi:hypothetical protein